jgi:hypothetical protein
MDQRPGLRGAECPVRMWRRNVRVRTLFPAPTPDHPQGVYLDHRAQTMTMLPIRAWATGPGLPCDVEFLVVAHPRRERPYFMPVEVTFRARGDKSIDTKVLRAPLLPELVAAAVAAAAVPVTIEGETVTVTSGEQRAVEVEEVRTLTLPPRGRRGGGLKIPDVELADVHRVWKASGGERGGTIAVAQQWNVERTTAWRAVQRAQAKRKRN